MIHPNGCEKCGQKEVCMDICRVVQPDSCDTTCFKHPENSVIPTKCSLQNGIDNSFKSQFIDWVKILNDIRILNHKKYADILTAKESVNLENGKTLEFTNLPNLESSNNNKFVYKLSLKEKNFSEFRQFDLILLSDKYDLEKAELNLGIIKNLTFENCLIELNKELKFVPKYILPYYPDRMEYLNFVGLYKGFMGESKLLRLLGNSNESLIEILKNVNIELLLGVPGSGKTTRVVDKVIELSQQGKKVFVTTFTNKAIDNIHKKLLDEDENMVKNIHRFGHTHRVDEVFHNSGLISDYHETESLKNELAEKTIFLSTLHSANSELVSNLTSYDYVIIDEASQINIPMSFVPLSLAKNVLLVGDHCQLPPLFSDEITENTSTKQNFLSIFETIWKNTKELIDLENRKNLTNQYRMAEEIIAYPSKLFYDGNITTDDIVKDHQDNFISLFNDEWKNSDLSELIDPTIPSLWLQVKSDNQRNSSRSNIDESNYCNEIISELLKSGIDPKQIGVITPFRLQVNTIKSSLFSSLGKDYPDILDNLQIDTIDRFQGSQKDIILISLCSSDLRNNFLIKDLRRLNVALTRSRFKRIILGDLQSFVSTENENNAKIAGIINDGFTKYVEYDN
jgi:superfamily I DNA and/or RNA helicase